MWPLRPINRRSSCRQLSVGCIERGKEMGDAFKSPSLWLDLDLLVVAGFDPSYDGKDGKLRVSYVIFKGF